MHSVRLIIWLKLLKLLTLHRLEFYGTEIVSLLAFDIRQLLYMVEIYFEIYSFVRFD